MTEKNSWQACKLGLSIGLLVANHAIIYLTTAATFQRCVLMMEAVRTSEMSLYINKTTWHYIPDRPVLPLSTIDTVPRAYEGMEGRKNKNKAMKSRKM
jgi:hypothetical protein